MKTRGKLLITFLLVIAPLVALNGYQLHLVKNDAMVMKSLVEGDFDGAANVARIESALAQVNTNILRMIGLGPAQMIPVWKKQNEERYVLIDKLIKSIRDAAGGRYSSELEALQSAFDAMREGQRRQVGLIEQGDAHGGSEADRQRGRQNAERTFALLQKLAAKFRDSASQQALAGAGNADLSAKVGLALLLLSLGLACVLIARFVASLLRQLGDEPDAARRVVTSVATGDLTNGICVKSDAEGSLMAAIDNMQHGLSGMIVQIRESAGAIEDTSARMSRGSRELSMRAEQQASSLEETAASLEQITASVNQNADSAQSASADASETAEAARRCGILMNNAIESMASISSASERIEDIISTIGGIAFQTNILALNAAVEAARAHEHGRGFSIVATEVRNLANRSAAAAKEIRELISSSAEKIAEGNYQVGQAGTAMKEILARLQQVEERIAEISTANREQSVGIGQISAAVNHLDHMTQENARLASDSAQLAILLGNNAARMSESVSRFRVQQNDGVTLVDEFYSSGN